MNSKIVELYTKLTDCMLENAMFHDEAMNAYNFLGLNGFKRMHEYYYECQLKKYKCIKMDFVPRHNGIIINTDIEPTELFPRSWKEHNQFDVSVETAQKTVKNILEQTRQQADKTKSVYSAISTEFMSIGLPEDADVVNSLFKSNYREKEKFDRLALDLKKVDYDFNHVLKIQKKTHDKYKKKRKKL